MDTAAAASESNTNMDSYLERISYEDSYPIFCKNMD